MNELFQFFQNSGEIYGVVITLNVYFGCQNYKPVQRAGLLDLDSGEAYIFIKGQVIILFQRPLVRPEVYTVPGEYMIVTQMLITYFES